MVSVPWSHVYRNSLVCVVASTCPLTHLTCSVGAGQRVSEKEQSKQTLSWSGFESIFSIRGFKADSPTGYMEREPKNKSGKIKTRHSTKRMDACAHGVVYVPTCIRIWAHLACLGVLHGVGRRDGSAAAGEVAVSVRGHGQRSGARQGRAAVLVAVCVRV